MNLKSVEVRDFFCMFFVSCFSGFLSSLDAPGPGHNVKFTVSHAMSESVKLDNYEHMLKEVGNCFREELEHTKYDKRGASKPMVEEEDSSHKISSRLKSLLQKTLTYLGLNREGHLNTANQRKELDTLNLRLNIKHELSNQEKDLY